MSVLLHEGHPQVCFRTRQQPVNGCGGLHTSSSMKCSTAVYYRKHVSKYVPFVCGTLCTWDSSGTADECVKL
eukprot:6045823-Amphidinium_carterae.1